MNAKRVEPLIVSGLIGFGVVFLNIYFMNNSVMASSMMPKQVKKQNLSDARSGQFTRERAINASMPITTDQTLFGEGFEYSHAWVPSDLWHLIPNIPGLAQPYYKTHSGSMAVWYGQESSGSYNIGITTTGPITVAQKIHIPITATDVTVSFWSWEETEQTGPDYSDDCSPTGPCEYDIRALYITGTITNTWKMLWSTEFTPTIEGAWHQVEADISSYAGQDVRIGFLFDSVDEFYNDNLGWFVDDIAIIMHDAPAELTKLSSGWTTTFAAGEGYQENGKPYLILMLGDSPFGAAISTTDGDVFYPVVPGYPYQDIPVAWTRTYTGGGGVRVGDIEFMVLGVNRDILLTTTKVTTNTDNINPPVLDTKPSIAVSPLNGNIGLAWVHNYSETVDIRESVNNIQYAIYDNRGHLVKPVTSLTNNVLGDNISNISPAIEMFPNGNILIAWHKNDLPGAVDPLYYTVLNPSGNTVKAITNLTGSDPHLAKNVSLSRLPDGNMLLAWIENIPASPYNVYYAVMHSDGSLIKAKTPLTDYGSSVTGAITVDIITLPSGNSVVVWMSMMDFNATMINYAVLNNSYHVLKPPTELTNIYNKDSNGFPSVTYDVDGNAVVVWVDLRYPRTYLYKALLDSSGNILVSPEYMTKTPGDWLAITRNGQAIGLLPPWRIYLPAVNRNH